MKEKKIPTPKKEQNKKTGGLVCSQRDHTPPPQETSSTTYKDTIGGPKVGCSQIVITRSEMDLHVALRPMRAFCSGASDETEAYVNCKLQENN